MLLEHAPECLCGTKSWNPGRVDVSHLLQYQSFTCSRCNRIASNISTAGGRIFIISLTRTGFSSENTDWVNNILLVAWRGVSKRLEAVRDAVEKNMWDAFCEDNNLPIDTKYYDMEEETQQLYDVKWKELSESQQWLRPAGFEKQKLPPQIPKDVVAFLPQGKDGWEKVGSTDADNIKNLTDSVP